ncbi:MAG: formate dehydrogenase subunit gamma [Desulfotalea sp.]
MKNVFRSRVGAGLCIAAVTLFWGTVALADGSSADYYRQLITNITGEDYGQLGGLFTLLQSTYFIWGFLLTITVVPAVFALHLLIIGAKHFDHSGKQILFFPFMARLIHFIGALSFTGLVVTGLMIVFGSYLGGGTPIVFARYVHLFSALLAVPAIVGMLVIWIKDALPAKCDIKWCLIAGGYLSKEKNPVPAMKFNAGQKAWYWCAIPGGFLMAATGFFIWAFPAGNSFLAPAIDLVVSLIPFVNTEVDFIRALAIVHNVFGMVLVTFFLTHVYMCVFAIAGSLDSMVTGYKPIDEVSILHSLHKYKESDVKEGH